MDFVVLAILAVKHVGATGVVFVRVVCVDYMCTIEIGRTITAVVADYIRYIVEVVVEHFGVSIDGRDYHAGYLFQVSMASPV